MQKQISSETIKLFCYCFSRYFLLENTLKYFLKNLFLTSTHQNNIKKLKKIIKINTTKILVLYIINIVIFNI